MTISKDLESRLKADFLANLMNHAKSDYKNLLVSEIVGVGSNAESVIENSLQSHFDLLDNLSGTPTPTVSPTTDIAMETQILPIDNIHNQNELLSGNIYRELPDIYSKMGSHVFRVVFYKVDNSERVMWFTKNPDIIETFGMQPQSKTESEEQELVQRQLENAKIRVFDLNKQQWRQVNFNRLVKDSEELSLMAFDINDSTWANLLHEDETLPTVEKEVFKHFSQVGTDYVVSSNAPRLDLSHVRELITGDYENLSDFVTESPTVSEIAPEQVEQVPVQEVPQEHTSISVSDYPEYIKGVALNNVNSVFSMLQDHIAKVYFYKKEGELREMWCTKNSQIVDAQGDTPKGDKTQEELMEQKASQISSGSLSVYDIQAKGWRRINLNKLATSEVIPLSFYSIEKPFWALDIKNLDTGLDISDFNLRRLQYNAERDFSPIEITDYTVDGLLELLAPTTDTMNSREVLIEQIRQQPDWARDILSENQVKVTFVKRNGDIRHMLATKNIEILTSLGIQNVSDSDLVDARPTMITVVDIEKSLEDNKVAIRRLNLETLTSKNNNLPFVIVPIGTDSSTIDINYYNEHKSNVLKVLDGELEGTREPITNQDITFGEVQGVTDSNDNIADVMAVAVEKVIPTLSHKRYSVENYLLNKVIKQNYLRVFIECGASNIVESSFSTSLTLNNLGIILGYNGVHLVFKANNSDNIKIWNNLNNKNKISQENMNALIRLIADKLLIPEEDSKSFADMFIAYQQLLAQDLKLISRQNTILNTKDDSIVKKLARIRGMLSKEPQAKPNNKFIPNVFKIEQHANSIISMEYKDAVIVIGDNRLYVYSKNTVKPRCVFIQKDLMSFNAQFNLLVEKGLKILQNTYPNDDFRQIEHLIRIYLTMPINLRIKDQNLYSYIEKD